MRSKKKYMCGQSRGGTPGKAVDSSRPEGKNPRDYHKVAVAFHGGDMNYEQWVKDGMKGYR